MPVPTPQLISGLYVAFFNRGPDKSGLDFWTSAAVQSQLNDNALAREMAKGFATHPFFTSAYGALSNAQFIDAVYTNIGGAPADANGKAFWLDALNKGLSRSDFVGDYTFLLLNITVAELQAQLNSKQITQAEYDNAILRQDRLTNKSEVGLKFVAALGAGSNLDPGTQPGDAVSLANDLAFRASQAIVAGVTENDASKDAPTTYLNGSPTLQGINTTFGANVVTPVNPGGATGTRFADTFSIDVATALADASGTNYQPAIAGLGAEDILRIDLPAANAGITTLAQLDGQQGVVVQVNPFDGSTVVNFGNDSNNGEVVAVVLTGVVDPGTVAVQIV